MKSNLNLAQAIVTLADKVYIGYAMERLDKEGPKANVLDVMFKYRAEAIRKYGYYGELWDGKPTKYVDKKMIEETCAEYHISKQEYDAFYRLKVNDRLEALSYIWLDGLREGMELLDEQERGNCFMDVECLQERKLINALTKGMLMLSSGVSPPNY